MDGWMSDGWMGGWLYEWMDRWMDGQKQGKKDEKWRWQDHYIWHIMIMFLLVALEPCTDGSTDVIEAQHIKNNFYWINQNSMWK